MDKRSEEVRRDPLDGGSRNPDTLAGEPGFDAVTESFRPETVKHDALQEETEVDAPISRGGAGLYWGRGLRGFRTLVSRSCFRVKARMAV